MTANAGRHVQRVAGLAIAQQGINVLLVGEDKEIVGHIGAVRAIAKFTFPAFLLGLRGGEGTHRKSPTGIRTVGNLDAGFKSGRWPLAFGDKTAVGNWPLALGPRS